MSNASYAGNGIRIIMESDLFCLWKPHNNRPPHRNLIQCETSSTTAVGALANNSSGCCGECLAKCGYDEKWILRRISTKDDKVNGRLFYAKIKMHDLYLKIIAYTLSFNHQDYTRQVIMC